MISGGTTSCPYCRFYCECEFTPCRFCGVEVRFREGNACNDCLLEISGL